MDLSGIRILDLTRLLPGPYATQLMADLGADVIKIEAPGVGDYAREMPPFTDDEVGAIFDAVNRGKRSVAIDLKTARGQSAFHELVAEADVLFESFRPGVPDRLGADVETVRTHNPSIIYCSLSGFGQTGPLAGTIGHDLTYQGYAGLLDLTRADEDATPQMAGFPVADMAGGLFAAFAILGALLSREHNGEGTYIDVSLAEVLASFGGILVHQASGDDPPRPGETELTGRDPWYDVYETADGRYVSFAALEPKFWSAFCEAVGRQDLEEVHGTQSDVEREALRAELEELFAERTQSEWLEDLDGVDAAVGPVLPFEETLSHPHVRERDLVQGTETEVPRIGFPGRLDGTRPETHGSPPPLGADTMAVLADAGLAEERLSALREDDVVAGPNSG